MNVVCEEFEICYFYHAWKDLILYLLWTYEIITDKLYFSVWSVLKCTKMLFAIKCKQILNCFFHIGVCYFFFCFIWSKPIHLYTFIWNRQPIQNVMEAAWFPTIDPLSFLLLIPSCIFCCTVNSVHSIWLYCIIIPICRSIFIIPKPFIPNNENIKIGKALSFRGFRPGYNHLHHHTNRIVPYCFRPDQAFGQPCEK